MITPVLVAGAVLACSRAQRGAGQGEEPSGAVATRSIDAVLRAHTDSLMAVPGVVGTAVGLCDGEHCIQVLAADSSVIPAGRIPPRLEGYRVVVVVTGTVRPR